MSGPGTARRRLRFALLTIALAIVHGVAFAVVFFAWIFGNVLGAAFVPPAAAPVAPAVANGGSAVVALSLPLLFLTGYGVPFWPSYVLNSLVYGAAVAGLITLIVSLVRRRGTAKSPPAAGNGLDE
ncbi:MAG TPA: hypothetical protein VGH33_15080 [Isosphaeraceae bacterium]|jgi:ABC-type thiamin/hydroxymethylpyrimidine transport system permease subunit